MHIIIAGINFRKIIYEDNLYSRLMDNLENTLKNLITKSFNQMS